MEVEELKEQLQEVLANLIHFFGGMLQDMESGTYSPEQAGRDWLALSYNENMDYLPLLAELMEAQEIQEIASLHEETP